MQRIDYTTYEKPSDYMKFPQGSTTIRILSSGGLMKQHSMRTANRFIDLGECQGVDCEHCKKGNEPTLKWVWIAINRDKVKLGVLKVGAQIGNSIALIGKKHGDPKEYDLTINKSGEGLKTTYIVAKKSSSEPLTADEEQEISLSKGHLINKYFKS